MRMRLTIDADVAEQLHQACTRTGRTLREEINVTLRRGLQPGPTPGRVHFRVVTRNMGALKSGLQIDRVSKLIEDAEGPLTR